MPPLGVRQSAKPPSLERRLWGGLLAVAGAATGLAVLVYVIGAATLWLALRNTGYSADIGIAHQPRTQIVALGLHGIVFVFALTLGLTLLGLVVMRSPLRRASWPARLLAFVTATVVAALAVWYPVWPGSRADSRTMLALIAAILAVFALGSIADRSRNARLVLVGVVSIVVVVGASFATWKWLA